MTRQDEQLHAVQQALIGWYRREGRPLPWRQTRDPYAILVSEVMLQQTQVERVIPRWQTWLERFPTLAELAAAPRSEVIRAWHGLGYNLRAVRLHEIAQQAVERFGGRLPDDLDTLLSLKGLGRYTAGAVACFAFGRPVAMVDTNIRRVLGRVFLGQPAAPTGAARALQALAEEAVPPDPDDAYAWNQALMDLGATLCSVGRPACLLCPLSDLCRAAPLMGAWPEERRRQLRESRASYATAARRQSDEQRLYRGRIVEALRGVPSGASLEVNRLGPLIRPDFSGEHMAWLETTLRKLARDGLLVLDEEGESGPRARLPD